MRLIVLLLTALTMWGAPAQRIVSTAPSITETLFAMGLGPRVVADTIYCAYPPEAAKLPKIGTLLKPDIETIVALHPDLVVVLKQPNDISAQLTRLHINWIEADAKNLDDIYRMAGAIGKAAGADAAAEHMVNTMQLDLRRIRELTSPLPKLSAAVLVGHTSGRLEGLIAGSGKSFFSDLLDAAGGTNIFSDTSVAYPKVSLEEILARNPDVILETSGESVQKQQEIVDLWSVHPSLKAVSTHRVYAIPPGAFLVPGPRATEAAKQLLHLLHPEIKLPSKNLFHLDGVGVRYGSAQILSDICLDLNAGEFVTIAGPNGAGKSTLLTLLAGLAAPSEGTCHFQDRPAHEWPRRDFARKVAVVQQAEPTAFPFTAEEVVYMGRMPHSAGFTESAEDHAAVTSALELTGMSGFRARDFRTLSGGEKQRILMASALAQAPEILLLDEPANHLDLQHQIALHRILRNLSRNGLLVVAVTHDLNLAAAYADRMVMLQDGRVYKTGTPQVVLTTQIIEQVFHVHAALHRGTAGQPWMTYGE